MLLKKKRESESDRKNMRKLRGEGRKVINVKLTTEGKLMRNEVMEATGKAGVQ